MEAEIDYSNINQSAEPASPTASGTDVIKEASQRYLYDKGIKLKIAEVERLFRQKPLRSIGLAAALGFIFAGGFTTRVGITLLAIFGRKAGREIAGNVVTRAVRSVCR
jgi:hypothetical protein